MSFTLMICESKQSEIIHREILLIFLMTETGDHCNCDLRKAELSLSVYL